MCVTPPATLSSRCPALVIIRTEQVWFDDVPTIPNTRESHQRCRQDQGRGCVKLSSVPRCPLDRVVLNVMLSSMLGVVPACDATFTIHMLHARVAGEVAI